MTQRIRIAIPTEEDATNYLIRNSQNFPNSTITPFIARELYNRQIITNKKSFKCPTSNCEAPITCRSIDPSSKNRPTFVNQSVSENKHAINCPYNPENYNQAISKDGVRSSLFKFVNSNETISPLSRRHGFSTIKKAKTSVRDKEITTTSGHANFKVEVSKKANYNQLKDKVIRTHLKTLREHVEMYNYNPNFQIITESSKKVVPIKNLFKPLNENIFFNDLNVNEDPAIYYSNAFLLKNSSDKVFGLSFSSRIHVNNATYYPSLIVTQSYIQENYPYIFDQLRETGRVGVKAYITLPFLKNETADGKTYVNFSSFKKSERIEPFIEELFNNLYIISNL